MSVKQPWAELIASGRKTVETRTWCTKYRGPLLICTGKKYDEVALKRLAGGTRLSSIRQFLKDEYPCGVAVAVVDLVDCRLMTEADCPGAMCGLNKHAWVLENARRVEQFPVKGQLGVFEVDYDATCRTVKNGIL